MPDENLPSLESTFASVPGGEELLAWFGHVPHFHDAEIISLHLNRKGVSTLKIHTWEMSREVDGEGYGIRRKDAVVTLALEEITKLQLEDFNIQNVIYGLELRRITREAPSFNMQWLQQPEPLPDLFEITLQPCQGLSGKIQARRITIGMSSGKPDSEHE